MPCGSKAKASPKKPLAVCKQKEKRMGACGCEAKMGCGGGSAQVSCCPPSKPNPCTPCIGDGCGFFEVCSCKNMRREKRWKQANFLKPCIDTRVYRNGEPLCVSYAGHVPGEQYIHGRNLPTSTTFAKRRLCQYTPYEFVDPDGCCSMCTYP